MAIFPFEKYYGEHDFKTKGINILKGVDSRVRDLFIEAAKDLEIEIYILACSKDEYFTTQDGCDDDRKYYFDDNEYMEEYNWELASTTFKQTWFDISRNTSFCGSLQIDNLAQRGVLALLNTKNADEFWGEEGDKEMDDCERTLYYSKDVLLIFPKKNNFKIFMLNSSVGLAMNSVNEFNDKIVDTFFSVLTKSKDKELDAKKECLNLLSCQAFLKSLKFEWLTKMFTIILLKTAPAAIFEVLSDEKLGLLQLFFDRFGTANIYNSILIRCTNTFFRSSPRVVVEFLLFLIRSNLHLLDEFSLLLESLSPSIVDLFTNSKDFLVPEFDLILIHSSNESLKTMILEHFLSNFASEKTRFAIEHLKKSPSSREFLLKLYNYRADWLRAQTLTQPTFSWRIDVSFSGNKEIEEFLQSDSERKKFSGFNGVNDARNFIRKNGFSDAADYRYVEGRAKLLNYVKGEASGTGKNSVAMLAKTRGHFIEMKNLYRTQSKELQEIKSWLGEGNSSEIEKRDHSEGVLQDEASISILDERQSKRHKSTPEQGEIEVIIID
jgi:hypothetical protein